jgi:hypothetical protein
MGPSGMVGTMSKKTKKANGAVGAARVRWLRTSLAELRRIAETVDRIRGEAIKVEADVAGHEDIQQPDPLMDMSPLGGEGMMVIAHEARQAIEIVESAQALLEARLRGEWDPVKELAALVMRLPEPEQDEILAKLRERLSLLQQQAGAPKGHDGH